jgi:hypothetical protein
MKKIAMLIGIMMAGAVMAEVKLAPLPAQQAAMLPGNQQLEFTFADLTVGTADIAQTNTFTLTGPVGLRFEGAKLEATFDDGLGTATTNNVTFTLKIDALTVVSAKQVASDQTTTDAVWIPGSFVTGTVAPLYGTITNSVGDSYVAVTNLSTAVTLAASQYAVAAGGSTITVTTIFTPSGGSALNVMKKGKIKAYFTKW